MSDLLNQASLVYIPSGYKEDTAYSVIPTDGSGDLTFTRASDGTRVNSQGLIERVPWNLVQQSNTFNTTWLSNGTTETGGQAGYDGTNDAWLLQRNDGLSRFVYQTTAFNSLTTFSVYAKAGNVDWLFLANGVGENHYFDLANGVLGNTGTAIDATIESAGNGYYRCSIVISNCSEVRIYPAINNGVISGLVGANIYIQDAQLNEGTTAKPYFPTTDRLNVPRLDYSGGCPSLLLEPQRTNYLTYSEQFDNGAWSKSYAGTGSAPIVTANQAISPDGTQNADKIILNQGSGSTSGDYSFIEQSITFTGDGVYSIYLKSATGSSYTVTMRFLNTTYNAVLTTEWQRFDLYVPSAASGIIGLWLRGSYGSSTYAEFYAWGAQLEAGSYPTSYIPTTSASVTRVADAAYKTGISSLIGQSEGTMFVDVDLTHFNFTAGNEYLMQLFEAAGERLILYRTSSNELSCYYLQGVTTFFKVSTITTNGRHKLAFAYKSGDSAFYIDGVQIDINTTTFSAFSSLNELHIGANFNPTQAEIGAYNYNQATVFPTRLTNAELASLTTL